MGKKIDDVFRLVISEDMTDEERDAYDFLVVSDCSGEVCIVGTHTNAHETCVFFINENMEEPMFMNVSEANILGLALCNAASAANGKR